MHVYMRVSPWVLAGSYPDLAGRFLGALGCVVSKEEGNFSGFFFAVEFLISLLILTTWILQRKKGVGVIESLFILFQNHGVLLYNHCYSPFPGMILKY